MTRKWTIPVWACVLIVALALAMPTAAVAMTRLEGNSVTLAKDKTVDDDLYAFGSSVTIQGTVNGDVVAFGQNVVISGDVSGSVIAAAQSVRVDGNVSGSVRAAGALVDVNGTVGGDVVAGAGQVNVGGAVKRDLVAGAQGVTIAGSVGRDVNVSCSSLEISGDVGGDVEAQSPSVTVAKTGSVDGSLDYWSAQPAKIEGTVSGKTTQHEPTTQTNGARAEKTLAQSIFSAIIAWIQSLVGMLVLGVLLVLLARGPMERGSRAVAQRLWPSLGVGALVFFVTPAVALVVFIVGLFIGVWWLSFVLLTVFALLLLAGVLVGSLAVGRAILSRATSSGEPALAWSMLLGLAIVWLVGAVPFAGWLASWGVMLVGTGALTLLALGKAEKPTPAPAPAVAAPAGGAPQQWAPPAQPPPAGPPVGPPMAPPPAPQQWAPPAGPPPAPQQWAPPAEAPAAPPPAAPPAPPAEPPAG
jgi:cytoskeletal protein CcmA (bactofilin family)